MAVQFGGGAFANTGATTYLGADVALNNTGSFFNGPNTGSLSPGTYLLIAKAFVTDSAAAALATAQIHDGTNAVDTAHGTVGAANFHVDLTMAKVITIAAATTFTLQAKSNQTTSTLSRSSASASTANLATNITAVRLF